MRTFSVLAASFFLLSAVGGDVAGKIPVPFAVFDPAAGRALIPETIVQEMDYFESIPETEHRGKPFLVSAVDYHTLKFHGNLFSGYVLS